MRNPRRIIKLITLIGKIWTKNPELRLCQLIGNCFTAWEMDKMYYIEDDELEARLRKSYQL